MLDFIAAAMREQLALYPTTIVEDDVRLASEGLEPFCNERNAVIVVRGEKEICEFWIEVADVARPLLVGSGSGAFHFFCLLFLLLTHNIYSSLDSR
jgi:hypothetical protein